MERITKEKKSEFVSDILNVYRKHELVIGVSTDGSYGDLIIQPFDHFDEENDDDVKLLKKLLKDA